MSTKMIQLFNEYKALKTKKENAWDNVFAAGRADSITKAEQATGDLYEVMDRINKLADINETK